MQKLYVIFFELLRTLVDYKKSASTRLLRNNVLRHLERYYSFQVNKTHVIRPRCTCNRNVADRHERGIYVTPRRENRRKWNFVGRGRSGFLVGRGEKESSCGSITRRDSRTRIAIFTRKLIKRRKDRAGVLQRSGFLRLTASNG